MVGGVFSGGFQFNSTGSEELALVASTLRGGGESKVQGHLRMIPTIARINNYVLMI